MVAGREGRWHPELKTGGSSDAGSTGVNASGG
jgi:hypothetical protein